MRIKFKQAQIWSDKDYISIATLMNVSNRDDMRELIDGNIILLTPDTYNDDGAIITPTGTMTLSDMNANIIEQVLNKADIRQDTATANMFGALYLFLCGLIIIIFACFVGWGAAFVAAASSIVTALWASYVLYSQYNILFAPAYLCLSLMMLTFIMFAALAVHHIVWRRRAHQLSADTISDDFIANLSDQHAIPEW